VCVCVYIYIYILCMWCVCVCVCVYNSIYIIDVFGFMSSLYLSDDFHVVPKERGSEESVPLTMSSGLIPVVLPCDGVVRDTPCSGAPVAAPPCNDCVV
jgi:hypothetical protein